MRLLSALLFLAALCAPVRTLAVEPAPRDAILEVPFLPQTEALCGGAAVAMVFRYWGDRHADVQQFASLVDRGAGGIADDALVRAVDARGWRTQRLTGTVATILHHLGLRQPLILLIEDRPSRYHFVVAVGADDRHVVVHDPAWGPDRRYTIESFLQVWKASGYWTLLVLPDEARRPQVSGADTGGAAAPAPPATACDRAVDDAIAVVSERGLDAADSVFSAVRERCPASSRPISELAGIRFAQRRYPEASQLAEQAVSLDPADEYGWDVLGSTRFVREDVHGALRAWNAIRRPRLDSVVIHGLERTRYALFARMLPLEPNTLLSADVFGLAERRLRELPAIVASRIALAPEEDGWATATVAVVERTSRPRGWLQWTVMAARAAVDRELAADVPGWSGQGEVWRASWRWWQNRPHAAFAFSAPAVDRAGGVWRVDAAWSAQQYETDAGIEPVREEKLRGGVSRSGWATRNLRYDVSGDLESWDGRRRAVSAGIRLDRRLAGDRVSLVGAARHWWPLTGGPGFGAADARLALRSSDQDRGFVGSAVAGIAAVSERAPFSEWPGAGDAEARSPLLRAHPLTRRGIVDSAAFGRRLAFASIEQRRWLRQPTLVGVAVAAFVDAARAWQQLDGSPRGPFVVDAGVGVRMRWPGQDAVLRLDYGRGIRDGAHSFTVGWQR